MVSLSSRWIWSILPLLMKNGILVLCTKEKTGPMNSDEGFFEALRMFKMAEKFPELGKSGTCFSVSNVTAIRHNPTSFTVILTMDIKNSVNKSVRFCRNKTVENFSTSTYQFEVLANGTDVQITAKDNNDSILAVSQTIGIVICGLLLTIFFFIAGFMRIKNFLRRNKTTLKINGLRSCLTSDDESNKWGTSSHGNNMIQPTVSNYLQLQSVMDRSVGQFMIKPAHYSKSAESDNRKTNLSIRRKTSIKNKLLPKRSTNQNAQRRYSLSNEIDSVMNKHFNMIGVSRKSGYRSTQNIGSFLQNSTLSQGTMSTNSMINSIDHRARNQTMNCIADTGTLNKSQPNRYFRNGNFPCRRATTIGGRSSNSRHVTSLRGLDTSSPPVDGMYSSQNSILNAQAREFLRKQLTSEDNKDSFVPINDSESCVRTEDSGEPRYLKVPPKPSNLMSTKKCFFNLNDEKTSPSPESIGTHSHCSSFEKASSIWSSLDVQDSEAVDKK